MTTQTYTEMCSLAEEAARAAGVLALRYAEDLGALHIEKKGVQDLVSRADREVEDLVRERLLTGAPGSSVMGEERGGVASTAGRLWVVDPIDGTTNYLHGIPHWCVSIALVDDGALCVGVVYDPVADEMFSAAVGEGAHVNGAPIAVSEATRLDEALVAYGESGRIPSADTLAVLGSLRSADVDLRKHGAGALSAVWVACGRHDAFFELHLNPWDALGALLVVREAGGRANDFLANGGLSDGNPLLVATPGLFEELARLTGIAV